MTKTADELEEQLRRIELTLWSVQRCLIAQDKEVRALERLTEAYKHSSLVAEGRLDSASASAEALLKEISLYNELATRRRPKQKKRVTVRHKKRRR